MRGNQMIAVMTGQTLIIGEEYSKDNDKFMIKKPVIVRYIQTPSGIQMDLIPVLPKPKDNIIWITNPDFFYEISDMQIKERYNEAVAAFYSNIKIAKTLSIDKEN
jgi:hypothetical protein